MARPPIFRFVILRLGTLLDGALPDAPHEDFLSFLFFMFLMAFSHLDRMWSVPPSPHEIASAVSDTLIYLSLIH